MHTWCKGTGGMLVALRLVCDVHAAAANIPLQRYIFASHQEDTYFQVQCIRQDSVMTRDSYCKWETAFGYIMTTRALYSIGGSSEGDSWPWF